MPATKRPSAYKSNAATLGFEEKLWAAADKLRGHMDAAEFEKHGYPLSTESAQRVAKFEREPTK